MIDHDEKLDATRLRCPLPVLRLKKIMNGMKRGKVLRVIAGYQMQIMKEEAGEFHFYIRKT